MTAVSRLDEVFKNGSISRRESRCCMLWQVSWLRSLLVCPQLPCRDSGHCFVCRPILLWLPYTLNYLSVKTDLVFISVTPVLAYTRCSVFVDWINEINQSVNKWTLNGRWMHQRAFVLVFLRTDMSNTPRASHPVMLSGCPMTTHRRCPVCLPHHSRPAASAASPVPQASLGRCWPANVTGSHFISNLIDRLNVSVAGGLGFTPQMFLSPLNYPRVLSPLFSWDWLFFH